MSNYGLWYRRPEAGGSMLVLYGIDLALHTEIVSKTRETVVRTVMGLNVDRQASLSRVSMSHLEREVGMPFPVIDDLWALFSCI